MGLFAEGAGLDWFACLDALLSSRVYSNLTEFKMLCCSFAVQSKCRSQAPLLVHAIVPTGEADGLLPLPNLSPVEGDKSFRHTPKTDLPR